MTVRRSTFAKLALAALLLATTACQTFPREPFTARQLAQASPAYRYDFSGQEARDRFADDTRRAAATASDGRFDLLALSGGGANGAWGAGVVTGWTDRPAFEVVTGVSTGALIAPRYRRTAC